MRRLLLPAAGAALLLSGCTMGGFPAPTPTPTESAAIETPTPAPIEDRPTTVSPLPTGAFLQLNARAVLGEEELRVVFTVEEAVPLDDPDGEEAWTALQETCPNAIESQLEVFPTLEPVGVILSTLEAEGELADAPFGVQPGGFLVNLGEGRNVRPAQDPPGMFGCAFATVTGPGSATFASLVLGEPGDDIDDALEEGLAQGRYSLEVHADAADLEWRDCVVQLSNRAERLAATAAWVPPGEWGSGCIIGDPGMV